MKKAKAIELISCLLEDHLDLEPGDCALVSELIYTDVVETAVDDERNIWIMLAARNGNFDS